MIQTLPLPAGRRNRLVKSCQGPILWLIIKMSERDLEADHEEAETYSQQCSGLKKNGYVVINGKACRITDLTVSNTGPGGYGREIIHVIGYDIFGSNSLWL